MPLLSSTGFPYWGVKLLSKTRAIEAASILLWFD